MKADPDGEHPVADPPAKPSRRWPLLVLGVVVLFVVGIIVIKAYLYAAAHESTDDAQVDGDLVVVSSKISERVDEVLFKTNQFVRRGQVLITLDKRDEERRYAQAQAVLHASEAQAQAAGANLSLTSDQQAAQLQQGDGGISQAVAGVSSAESQVSQAQNEAHVARANVTTAQEQLKAAQAAYAGAAASEYRAAADLRRVQRLAQTGDAPASELDTAQATAVNARSSLDQASANIAVARASLVAAIDRWNAQKSAVAAAQSNVQVQAALVTTAQGKRLEAASPFRLATQRSAQAASTADVATQRAAVALAKDQLAYTIIRSPIDGYIGEKDVQLGKMVAPGETLLTIVPQRGLFITANFKETQVGRIHQNQPVEIAIDAYPGLKVDGRVVALPPASQATYSLIPAQNSTGNFVKVTQRLPVRIAVESGIDEAHPLRVGMSVETSVKVK